MITSKQFTTLDYETQKSTIVDMFGQLQTSNEFDDLIFLIGASNQIKTQTLIGIYENLLQIKNQGLKYNQQQYLEKLHTIQEKILLDTVHESEEADRLLDNI